MQVETVELSVDSDMTSPFAVSAYVALKHKGFAVTIKKIDLEKRENRGATYSGMSLTSRVPLLHHGDFFLSESSAISEYLEEFLPPPKAPSLFPNDIRQRARARQIQAWLRSDLMSIRTERSTDVIFVAPSTKPLSQRAKACARQLYTVAESLLPNDRLSENIFGDWCIADTDLAVMLKRLVANGDDVPKRLVDYVSYQWSNEHIQSWMNARIS